LPSGVTLDKVPFPVGGAVTKYIQPLLSKAIPNGLLPEILRKYSTELPGEARPRIAAVERIIAIRRYFTL